MTIEDLKQLFGIELRYAYDCGQKLVKKGLPSMVEAASSPRLKDALEQHLEETRSHISRVEQIFSMLGADAKTEDNDVLDELTSAAKDMASDVEGDDLRDAALIASGNQVEHYEIALYGSLVAFAQQLGLQEAVRPLQILTEEKAADAKLTVVGETLVNSQAAQQRKAA